MDSGTSFESSIKAYSITMNGREAYKVLCQHNIGSLDWDKILEYAETYVMKREWNGNNHIFTLLSHIINNRES